MTIPDNSIQASNTSWQSAIWLLSLLSALFLFVWIAPFHHPFESLADYLPLHTLAETFSVVVAVMIFGVGWHAYEPSRPMNVVLIACAFLAVGLLDFGHFMSYSGMPDFVTPSSPTKFLAFWLAARFIAAIALLAAAMMPWTPYKTPRMRYFILAFCIAYTAIAYWVTLFHPHLLPELFIAEPV